ncbi:hypothetical protein [Pseudalkalibacillus salsuginis]|uniref:hypothetical protein n=1 Tax=Pseudalkalibacillus salsuginis TaxID=2910972 RepID=UPI001F2FF8DB|nr:hypothetical protein [Pseudalkalibacillus salsuginis]MCF6408950.1 hypothetical protein [Pseudalkalibacillus salsuginis]
MKNRDQQVRIHDYMRMFNEKMDYVECHHISREMLIEGDNKPLAKCLATLSALVEQADKKKWAGYNKLHKTFLQQLDEIDDFPFDEEDLKMQLQHLDEQVKYNSEQSIKPIQLSITIN